MTRTAIFVATSCPLGNRRKPTGAFVAEFGLTEATSKVSLSSAWPCSSVGTAKTSRRSQRRIGRTSQRRCYTCQLLSETPRYPHLVCASSIIQPLRHGRYAQQRAEHRTRL